jgi:hypothetical protein
MLSCDLKVRIDAKGTRDLVCCHHAVPCDDPSSVNVKQCHVACEERS